MGDTSYRTHGLHFPVFCGAGGVDAVERKFGDGRTASLSISSSPTNRRSFGVSLPSTSVTISPTSGRGHWTHGPNTCSPAIPESVSDRWTTQCWWSSPRVGGPSGAVPYRTSSRPLCGDARRRCQMVCSPRRGTLHEATAIPFAHWRHDDVADCRSGAAGRIGRLDGAAEIHSL